jgi:hypothetical protein
MMTNDIALAKFSREVSVSRYRPIEWHLGPLPHDTKLYLLGRKTGGQYDSRDTTEVVRGIIGGWRYIMDVFSHNYPGGYETAIIWRCNSFSIVGDSGSLLLRVETPEPGVHRWYGVGFQSQELGVSIAPLGMNSQKYWKIAFRPPADLVKEYWALSPSEIIAALENDNMNWM